MIVPLEKTLKRGDLRKDGFIFSNYAHRKGERIEVWRSPKSFAKMVEGLKRYRENNREKVAESIRDWQRRNRDKTRAYVKKWADKNIAYNQNRGRAYRDKNRTLLIGKRKEWYENNKALASRKNKLWRESNPEKDHARKTEHKNKHLAAYYARDAERRAKMAGCWKQLSPGDKQIVRTIYEVSSRVTACLGIKHHVDHIVPLNPPIGTGVASGLHTPSNLQVLPARLNQSKGNQIL